MDAVIVALAPALVAGMAVQRIIELLDSVTGHFGGMDAKTKKLLSNAIAIACGIAVALIFDLRVLSLLGADDNKAIDAIITGLVVSTGTEGINSIVKFLGYKKEEKKVEANEGRRLVAASATSVEGAVG